MPLPVAMPSTLVPTLNGSPSTLPVLPSIRVTVPSSWLLTQTTPCSSTATPSGPLPTLTLATAVGWPCFSGGGVAVAVGATGAAAVAPFCAAAPPPSLPRITPAADSTTASRASANTVPSEPPIATRWRCAQGSGSSSSASATGAGALGAAGGTETGAGAAAAAATEGARGATGAGASASAASAAWASAPAVEKRSSASLASASASTSSSAAGTSGASAVTVGIGSLRCAYIFATSESRSYGASPARQRKSTQPSAYTSARPSAGSPRICSGAQ